MNRWLDAARQLAQVALRQSPGTAKQAQRICDEAREAYEQHVKTHGCADLDRPTQE